MDAEKPPAINQRLLSGDGDSSLGFCGPSPCGDSLIDRRLRREGFALVSGGLVTDRRRVGWVVAHPQFAASVRVDSLLLRYQRVRLI